MTTWKVTFLAGSLLIGPSAIAKTSCLDSPSLIRRMPVSKFDEADKENEERRAEIGLAIDQVGQNRTERAFLAMTARREGAFARFVDLDEEKCKSDKTAWCDWGRAYSVWQLHGMRRDETRDEAADIAIDRFRGHANYCKKRGFDYIEGGISLYATGKSCAWPEAKERAKELRSIAGSLCP